MSTELELVLRDLQRLSSEEKGLMHDECTSGLSCGCRDCNVMSSYPGFFETHRNHSSHTGVVHCRLAHAAILRDGGVDPYHCSRCGCDNQSAEGHEAHVRGKAHRKALQAHTKLKAYELLLAALNDIEDQRVEAEARQVVDKDGEGKGLSDEEEGVE